MPDDRERRVLVQAADSGSFTRAARVLGVTVSTVTRVVERVERAVGARLFVRTAGGARPTEAGVVYLAHARAVLRGEAEAREAIDANKVGTLRVSVPVFVAEHVLPGVVPAFLAAHPGSRLDVHASDDYVDLAGGAYDLAIRRGPLPDSTLRMQRLAEYASIAVASPSLFGRRRPAHPSELATVPALAYGAGPGRVDWPFRRGAERAVVSVLPVVRTNNVDLLADLARAGEGVAVIPDWALGPGLVRLVEPWSIRGALQAVFPDDPAKARLRRTFLSEIDKLLSKRK
jgi:DNA-binding transcriptional LysR family regulator